MSDPEPYSFPDLSGEDQFHLQQLENNFGKERVIGWLRGKVAVPLQYQFTAEFDKEAYYEAMREHYVDTDTSRQEQREKDV
jgi:hypothetical protein